MQDDLAKSPGQGGFATAAIHEAGLDTGSRRAERKRRRGRISSRLSCYSMRHPCHTIAINGCDQGVRFRRINQLELARHPAHHKGINSAKPNAPDMRGRANSISDGGGDQFGFIAIPKSNEQ